MYEEIIDRIQSNGIGVIGSFIVGLDSDDTDTFEHLKEFIFKTRLYGASITVNTPYPGTELYKEMKALNRIVTYDWDNYTIFQPVVKPAKISMDELNDRYLGLLITVNSPEYTSNKLEYFKEKLKNIRN